MTDSTENNDKNEKKPVTFTDGTNGQEKASTGYDVPGDRVKEEPESKTDDYGYPKDEEKPVEKKEEAPSDDESSKKKDEPEAKDNPDEKSATGYGDEPPKKEDAPDVKDTTKDGSGEPDKVPEINTEGLLDSEVSDLKDFVKANKLTPEAHKALVDYKKQEVAKLAEYMENKKTSDETKANDLRRQQHDELSNDAEFGGEKFKHNVKQVDKVIDQFMPNLKNKLTESGVMLPPYVMKDLAKLAKRLYSTESLTQGEPSKLEDTNDKELDPLEYYNS